MRKLEWVDPNFICDVSDSQQSVYKKWLFRFARQEELEAYLVEVRRGCTRMGVDYTLVKTSDYLDAVLSKFLHQRMALRGPSKSRAQG